MGCCRRGKFPKAVRAFGNPYRLLGVRRFFHAGKPREKDRDEERSHKGSRQHASAHARSHRTACHGAVSQAEGTVQKLNPIPQGTVVPLNTEAAPKVAPQVQPVQPLKTQTVNGASVNGINEVKDDNLSDILLAE